MADGLCELMVGDHCQQLRHVSDAEDLFSILETWEDCMNGGGGGGGASAAAVLPAFSQSCTGGAVGARPTGSSRRRSGDEEKGGGGAPPVQKKQKGSALAPDGAAGDEGTAKMSHIAVERNRRKQMNEHIAVLRSLMPCFYVKRGDQASIIGGGVDYIKELQQLLRSLEAKMHRKAYAEHVLSPRLATAASPRPPPLSPRVAVPISPRTPTPGSPYKPGGGRPPHPASAAAAAAYMASPTMTPTTSSSYSYDQQQQHYSPQPYLPTLDSIVTELAARPLAAAGLLLPEVKVEFAGPNLVLKTVSLRAEGQALKIIAALESLSLEILHVSVITVDDTMVHSFTIKIGIECELSAEELVQKIHQTFS